MTKLEAALDIEINIDEAFGAIEGYLGERDPHLLDEIQDAEADFGQFLAIYRATSLSADEGRWLEQIENNFTDSKQIGEELVALEDEITSLDDGYKAGGRAYA